MDEFENFDISKIEGLTEFEREELHDFVLTDVAKQMIQTLQKSLDLIKIQGKHFSQEKLDRYNELILRCLLLFKDCKYAKIKNISSPSSDMPFANISVRIDAMGFSITKNNKENYIKIIELADEVVTHIVEDDCITKTFFVNDIWTE